MRIRLTTLRPLTAPPSANPRAAPITVRLTRIPSASRTSVLTVSNLHGFTYGPRRGQGRAPTLTLSPTACDHGYELEGKRCVTKKCHPRDCYEELPSHAYPICTKNACSFGSLVCFSFFAAELTFSSRRVQEWLLPKQEQEALHSLLPYDSRPPYVRSPHLAHLFHSNLAVETEADRAPKPPQYHHQDLAHVLSFQVR